MKKLLISVLFLLICSPAFATTWYIRLDGGTQTQCTGQTNAPYPGSGSAQPCAFNHPFYLLNQSTFAWIISGGDTIQFEDLGPYYIGQQQGAVGTYWNFCGSNHFDCHFPSTGIPAGTASNPTRFLGLNAGHCSSGGLPSGTTTLSGINGVFWVFTLQNSSYVDMECIDITQKDTCTTLVNQGNTITNTSMAGGIATYSYTLGGNDITIHVGEFVNISGTTNGGGVFNVTDRQITSVTGTSSGTFTIAGFTGSVASAADTGTQAFYGHCTSGYNYAGNGLVLSYLAGSQGPSNATLKDIAVHGIGGAGVLGGKMNTSPTDVFTASDIYIAGNGTVGWTSDSGGCTTNCEAQGTMNLDHITSIWNGCVEVQPDGGAIGSNGYNYCVDQQWDPNGNGDGLVMIPSFGTWNWTHIYTAYNAQDGFDGLHIGDDPDNLPDVNLSYIYSIGNEGQSIKGGGKNVTVTNSVGIANCNVFATDSNFPLNPPGWNTFVGLTCRANDAMAFSFRDGDTLTLEYITNIGEQNVSWDMANANCTTNCIVTFKNNTTMGFIGPSGEVGGINFGGPDSFANASSSITNNAWWHIGSSQNTCPSQHTYETAYVCTDPQFVNESNVNTVNPMLTSGSSLIEKGVAIPGITTDYAGNVRPDPPSIGAYEFKSNPSTAAIFSGTVMFSGEVKF